MDYKNLKREEVLELDNLQLRKASMQRAFQDLQAQESALTTKLKKKYYKNEEELSIDLAKGIIFPKQANIEKIDAAK